VGSAPNVLHNKGDDDGRQELNADLDQDVGHASLTLLGR
jgi:hypothetical protein